MVARPRTIFPKAITVVVELAVIFTFEEMKERTSKKLLERKLLSTMKTLETRTGKVLEMKVF